MFPAEGICQSLVDRYNAISRAELEQVRDFIVLHYHANQRDEPMWKACREMELPASLTQRIEQFRERAHAWQGEDELFRVDSWTHVMLGQGITPRQHHPLARGLADADMRRLFDGIRQPIDRLVATMPSHQQFIEQYCKADSSVWAGRRN